jgi:multiple sugar transport system substrate-binding protein
MKKSVHVGSQRKPRGLTRRDFIKTGATGAALAAGAGLGLFGGRAPLFAKGGKVHVLAWAHFIKEADELMRGEFATELKKSMGVDLEYETINANDIPARATAAVESGTGPDIFQFQWNQPHLYANGMENHNKLAHELHAERDYPYMRESAQVQGVYRGVPFASVGNATAYRKDVFEKAGVKAPDTWEEYMKVGKAIKDAGFPVGFTLGHTFGDAPANAYPLLWSYGGAEVDKKGKVHINSKGTLQACEFMKEFFPAACDPGVLAWDDSSNNRAFFAETIGATQNGASIYFVSKNHPDQVPPGLADKIGHFLNPKGPAGRYHVILSFTHSIAKYSKNKGAAMDYVRFVMHPDHMKKYLEIQQGYTLGPTPAHQKLAFWDKLPETLKPYRENPKYGRNFGYAGPYSRAASEVQAKYIIIDLFARVCKGTSAKDSIAQAEKELKLVYEA